MSATLRMLMSLLVMMSLPLIVGAQEESSNKTFFENSTIRLFSSVISSGTPSVQGETNIDITLTGSIEIQGFNIDGSAVVSGAYKEKLATDLSSAALGLYYIHSSGFGVGYASNTMKYEVDMIATQDIPVVVSAVDVLGVTVSTTVIVANAGQTFGLQTITIKSQFLDLLYNLEDLVFEDTVSTRP